MKNNSDLISKISSFQKQASEEIRVLGPYSNNNENRKIVIVINPEGKRKTISYPKYLYMKENNIDLFSNYDMTIDHKNFDHSDNRIENLRALPRDEHSAEDTRRVRLIKLRCTNCNSKFERSPRLMRDKNKKGNRGTFCSRSCSALFFRNKNNKDKIDTLQVQDYVSSEYYRRKKVRAFLFNFFVKNS